MPAGVFPNYFGYWQHISLFFAVDDFAWLGFSSNQFSKLYTFKRGMCRPRERNSFIELRICVAIRHFVLTMRTENSTFSSAFTYTIRLRTRLQHICESLRNFELKDFLSNCIIQHTTSIKY